MSDAEQLFQFPPHDHVFLGRIMRERSAVPGR